MRLKTALASLALLVLGSAANAQLSLNFTQLNPGDPGYDDIGIAYPGGLDAAFDYYAFSGVVGINDQADTTDYFLDSASLNIPSGVGAEYADFARDGKFDDAGDTGDPDFNGSLAVLPFTLSNDPLVGDVSRSLNSWVVLKLPGGFSGDLTYLLGYSDEQTGDPLGQVTGLIRIPGAAVPEPGSVALFAGALVGGGLIARRRRK